MWTKNTAPRGGIPPQTEFLAGCKSNFVVRVAPRPLFYHRAGNPALGTTALAKGFGTRPVQSATSTRTSGKNARDGKLSQLNPNAASTPEMCPCGLGNAQGERKLYKECCGRFHGGVKEPDAPSLMRARYSAYAKGVIPYIVRTTHSRNPDVAGGPAQLKADCEETCGRVVFKRLDVISVDGGEDDQEACVTFRAVYAYKHGTTGENQVLVEKSRFVREEGRWWYREKVPIDAASDALWCYSALLADDNAQATSQATAAPRGVYGRAQPKLRPRSR